LHTLQVDHGGLDVAMPQKSGRKRHGPLLPVLRSEPPKRFGSHAHQTIAKIHVTPSDMTNLAVAETRSEQELEKYRLILGPRV
jgi:hypothetical protein